MVCDLGGRWAIIASGSNLIKMHYIGFPARIPRLYIPVEPITIFSGGGGGGTCILGLGPTSWPNCFPEIYLSKPQPSLKEPCIMRL